MDPQLIEYLQSGNAWVFVGSGLSTQAGYPSWRELATESLSRLSARLDEDARKEAVQALTAGDFPGVFEQLWRIEGTDGAVLLESLRKLLVKGNAPKVSAYEVLCSLPVPVFLTTNFDDELASALARAGFYHKSYGNSPDHVELLASDLRAATFKLHGELTTSAGLILTRSQYREIKSSDLWEAWRTKLASTFQFMPCVVVGHSLTDPHVQDVLKAARKGASPGRPVFWLTDDRLSISECATWLREHRIKVIPYENSRGDHSGLLRILESIARFVPPRSTVKRDLFVDPPAASKRSAGASMFVFNIASSQADYEPKRLEVLVAALKAVAPRMTEPEFTLQEALSAAGWPKDHALGADEEESLAKESVGIGLLVPGTGGRFALAKGAEGLVRADLQRFEHDREIFVEALTIKAQDACPALGLKRHREIAERIERSLVTYFRRGGLTLASALVANPKEIPAFPVSVCDFVNDASTFFEDHASRQAFFDASISVFAEPSPTSRSYLGRLSQGFFAFHALGVFGDVAKVRFEHARKTVWLLDSNILIKMLARRSTGSEAVTKALGRLTNAGVGLFSTWELMKEAWSHLQFASRVIKDQGESSQDVISAATGRVPYDKSNQFLEGFLRFKADLPTRRWADYLLECFGSADPKEKDIRHALKGTGALVVPSSEWPGFVTGDLVVRRELADVILSKRLTYEVETSAVIDRLLRKSDPEAEAVMIVRHERAGRYKVFGAESLGQAWFISDSSFLNSLAPLHDRVTWKSEVFLRFAATLAPPNKNDAPEEAFEAILQAVATSGLSLLSEETIRSALGGAIEQARIDLAKQLEVYDTALAQRYAEVVENTPPFERLGVTDQTVIAMLEKEREARASAEARLLAEEAKVKAAAKKLAEVEDFRKRMERKKASRPKHRRPQKKRKR